MYTFSFLFHIFLCLSHTSRNRPEKRTKSTFNIIPILDSLSSYFVVGHGDETHKLKLHNVKFNTESSDKNKKTVKPFQNNFFILKKQLCKAVQLCKVSQE